MWAIVLYTNSMIAYKLLRQRKDGSLGSLFINKKQKLKMNTVYIAENHPTKGFAVRPSWHCTNSPNAPHLSMKERVWAEVEIKDFVEMKRPANQGGIWYLAGSMRILRLL